MGGRTRGFPWRVPAVRGTREDLETVSIQPRKFVSGTPYKPAWCTEAPRAVQSCTAGIDYDVVPCEHERGNGGR